MMDSLPNDIIKTHPLLKYADICPYIIKAHFYNVTWAKMNTGSDLTAREEGTCLVKVLISELWGTYGLDFYRHIFLSENDFYKILQTDKRIQFLKL